jgi:hypothetical protein
MIGVHRGDCLAFNEEEDWCSMRRRIGIQWDYEGPWAPASREMSPVNVCDLCSCPVWSTLRDRYLHGASMLGDRRVRAWCHVSAALLRKARHVLLSY